MNRDQNPPETSVAGSASVRGDGHLTYSVPEPAPAVVTDLGPIIDPPFVDGILRAAPDAGIVLIDVPFERLPDRPEAELAARARTLAEADPRVVAALGRRSEFIGVAMLDHKSRARPELRIVWYAYETNQRVEARADDQALEVRAVITDACQPALTQSEQARANDLVSKSGRLPGARDGRGLLVELTDPANARYGHRLVDLRFDPYCSRLPRWWAVVDLSAAEVVDTGDVPGGQP